MLSQRFYTIAMRVRRPSRWGFVLGITCAALSLLGMVPRTAAPQALNAPPTVEKLTIAIEAWGGDSLNPVHAKTVNFLWANFLPFLVSRDEQYNIVPALATSWEGSPEGWTFILNPAAKWEDGTPITAEDVKFSFEATMGMHDFIGATAAGRMKRSIEAIEVSDPQTVFIKTKAPTANFFLDYSGAGYVGFGIVPKHYLLKVGAEGFAKKPLGGGPFKVKEWVPGHRIVFERNEAFWGQYPWYTKPQVRVMEIIRVPDGAARFAMLKSGQADVILPTDLAIAKNLPRQPGKGTWVQPLFGTAQALISFNSLLAAQEGQCPEEPYWSCWPKTNPDVEVGPFADIRVREALDLAVDKKIISEKIHGGLSTPTGSVFSLGAFGLRGAFDVVMQRLPATLQLSGTAFIFSVVFGVGIGILSATRPDTMVDRLSQVLAVAGQSMPVFCTAILLILFFSVYLGWLPSAGGISRSGLKALILPSVALGWFFVAAHMRIVRSSMLEVLNSEYVKLLRGKGMPRRVVIWKHAFKNAAVPVFTLFALNFANLVAGAVITETMFTWPGIGSLVVDSIQARDYAVVQTIVIFVSAITVLTNLSVDLIYAWLDPRIRFG